MTDTAHGKEVFERASSMLRVQGIISIIFGALGTFAGLLMVFLFALGVSYNDFGYEEALSSTLLAIMVVVFVILPHVYLIISGTTLLRRPQPSVAFTLTIINLIVGVFFNLVVLIFAIISLTQADDYKRHYPKEKN